ncbi:hypothetical protein [Bacillus sp. V33-4]|uniref:hypothetical protein n=1 Tax=Bacillus sp. V33-4 TaxID=2054169 RepID=UPI000C75E74D|nr:hypothetical protein [Bacillus sp. V33-4]PLR85440.1 hypothetical protein CVD23_08670 [Bacillus sp. V33-4]
MKKKLLLLIGGSLLSAMFLAGCGDDQEPPPEDDVNVEDPAGDNDNGDVEVEDEGILTEDGLNDDENE